jgi:SAM-dependent methyltransferase
MSPLRLNVGCGHEVLPGFVNVDLRTVPGLDLRGDVLRLPFADASAAEIRAGSLLEHFADPCDVLDELHRVLAPEGRLVVRVPALGTNAAHLDPTHRFLADLAQWRAILLGYFGRVRVGSVGVKYRSSPLLVAIQRALIAGLRFHDLGQCWILTATVKRPRPVRAFRPWWIEASPARSRALRGHREIGVSL